MGSSTSSPQYKYNQGRSAGALVLVYVVIRIS